MPFGTRVVFGVVSLTVLVGAVGLARQTDRVLVASRFDSPAHGWVIAGDTGEIAPILHATGGNPGGYISNEDEALGETWYFRAPESLLERLQDAENGTLSFDLQQSAAEPGYLDDDVVIVGPAGRLSYRFRASPDTTWTGFSVKLSSEAGWRWNWNAPATPEQMRSVLARPTSLDIRGEYHTGPDVGGLDNVVLSGR